jgi:hypothetical protein
MNSIPEMVIRIYDFLLRLYPNSFRNEFQEQMLLDFSDMAKDAWRNGKFSFFLFCLHELIDFAPNLLRIHLKQGSMPPILRSQPVTYGIRSAITFAATFFFSYFISMFVFWKFSPLDDVIGNLQVYYFDLFHTTRGAELFFEIPFLISVLLTGLIFGCMAAVFLADRSRYRRYIVVGMLVWFLHHELTSILLASLNIGFYLGTRHATFLLNMMSILSGSFLGLFFVVGRSKKKASLRALVLGAFAYPALIFFYIQLLFQLGIVETPGMFIALMFLVVIYMASVVLIAIKSETGLRIPWTVMVFAFGSPLLTYVFRFLLWLFPVLNSVSPPYSADAMSWQTLLLMSVQQGVTGLLWGLLVAAALGLERMNKSIRLAANSQP